MNTFFKQNRRNISRFFLFLLLIALVALLPLSAFSACKKSVEYFSYVSELRSNIFLAEADGFSLRIHSLSKEIPYAADGIPKKTATITEVKLVAPDGGKTCRLTFQVNNQEYGGEMSFDNVKTEYYLSCTLNTDSCNSIPCTITYGEKTLRLEASSVRTDTTLSPKAALACLLDAEKELFSALTDKYGFAGEIHIRMIFENSPYYYIGIIDRKGTIHAYLLNAETGKILAKRQN
jgi:hypothetical protein